MRFGVMILVAGALALSACAPKEDKDDGVANGACTQATLDAYNNVVGYGIFNTSNKTVDQSCADLQGLLHGRSCDATSVRTAQTISVSYAKVQNICEPTTDASATPIPAPSRRSGSDYADSDGRCNKKFDVVVGALGDLLNQSVRKKDAGKARSAIYLCQNMETDLLKGGCRRYNSKTQEFETESRYQGELGKLCDGALKLSKRFK